MTIAFVNEAHLYVSGASTTIAAAAGNHTSGNLLVVLVVGWFTGTVSSVSDTAGNTYTWTGLRSTYYTADDGFVEIWYAKNITGNASNVVTATYSGSTSYREIEVIQYSGADTDDPFDAGNDTETGDAVGAATANSTVAEAGEVIVAGFAFYNSGTSTMGTGFTERYDGEYTTFIDRVLTTSGSYNASLTYSSANGWTGAHATFKALPEGPVITNAGDEDFALGETNIVVTGTDFLSPQSTGKLELGDSATYGSATLVTQSIDSWANTSIQFDLTIGSLEVESLWLYVTNSAAARSSGYAVTVNITIAIAGITKDSTGTALGSCDCYLFKNNATDDVPTYEGYVLSHATTGAYSFTVSDTDAKYFVIAKKDGTDNVFDTTDHVLVPVIT